MLSRLLILAALACLPAVAGCTTLTLNPLSGQLDCVGATGPAGATGATGATGASGSITCGSDTYILFNSAGVCGTSQYLSFDASGRLIAGETVPAAGALTASAKRFYLGWNSTQTDPVTASNQYAGQFSQGWNGTGNDNGQRSTLLITGSIASGNPYNLTRDSVRGGMQLIEGFTSLLGTGTLSLGLGYLQRTNITGQTVTTFDAFESRPPFGSSGTIGTYNHFHVSPGTGGTAFLGTFGTQTGLNIESLGAGTTRYAILTQDVLDTVRIANLANAGTRPYITTNSNGLLSTGLLAAVATSGSATDITTGTLPNAQLTAAIRAGGFQVAFGGADATVGVTQFFTIGYACTITDWVITADAGTATVKLWRIADGGTARPTAGNSLSTAGFALSTGTRIHSTTLTDLSSTAIAAYDTFGVNLSAVATATNVTFTLGCQK